VAPLQGRNRTAFIVAAVVCGVALVAAFVAGGGFDLIVIDDDSGVFVAAPDGSSTRADTTDTTRRRPPPTRAPGGSTTTRAPVATEDEPPPESTAPPEPSVEPATDTGRAALFLQEKFEMCVADSGIDPVLGFGVTYAAEPTGTPSIFTATLTVPTGPAARFTIDLDAGSITPVDEIASDFIAACPNFSATGA
jgi:hypothetical protein